MPSKKSTRYKKHARAKKSPAWTKLPRLSQEMGVGVMVLLAIVIMGGTMMFAGGDSPKPADSPRVDRPALSSPAEPAAAAAGESTVASAEPTATVGVGAAAPVTITGCLERADETFRLKNASGANLPKARSWKSAFLKKNSASIEIVDATRRLNLSNHIGQRVSVTGTLIDREMRARSVQRVGETCSAGVTRVKV
jgi:hypothetical protein